MQWGWAKIYGDCIAQQPRDELGQMWLVRDLMQSLKPLRSTTDSKFAQVIDWGSRSLARKTAAANRGDKNGHYLTDICTILLRYN